jgi:hypothetical protein
MEMMIICFSIGFVLGTAFCIGFAIAQIVSE